MEETGDQTSGAIEKDHVGLEEESETTYVLLAVFTCPIPSSVPPRYPTPSTVKMLEVRVKMIALPTDHGIRASTKTRFE